MNKIVIPFFGAGSSVFHIGASKLGLNLTGYANSSDITAVDVTPNGMNTSSIPHDTGDGIHWFSISKGSTATGDFSLEAMALEDNNGTTTREAEIVISDDAGNADDLVIIVHQVIKPT